jgi:hypothetical protein
MMVPSEPKYCDGFAQGIAGWQTTGRVLAHAPRNNTVEAFPSCLRMYRVMQCYTTHEQVTSYNSTTSVYISLLGSGQRTNGLHGW